MRTYEKTHPWLTFQIDLRLIEHEIWIALGEAQSKCEHISGVPLRPSVAQQLHMLYLAKGVLATTAIEGNTLTESEVIKHLEGKLELPPSKEYLSKEIDNIITACDKIATDILFHDKAEFSVEKIKNYNKLVLDGLSLDESIVPGQARRRHVEILLPRRPWTSPLYRNRNVDTPSSKRIRMTKTRMAQKQATIRSFEHSRFGFLADRWPEALRGGRYAQKQGERISIPSFSIPLVGAAR